VGEVVLEDAFELAGERGSVRHGVRFEVESEAAQVEVRRTDGRPAPVDRRRLCVKRGGIRVLVYLHPGLEELREE